MWRDTRDEKHIGPGKGHLDRNLERPLETSVVCGTTVTMARSTSPHSTLTVRTGLGLAVMPGSKGHASPRREGILFRVRESERRAEGLAVRYRAGIATQFPIAPQRLHGEGLSVSGRQSLECFHSRRSELVRPYIGASLFPPPVRSKTAADRFPLLQSETGR